MRHVRAHSIALLAGLTLTAAACTTNPETGRSEISRTAVGAVLGAGAGYLLGDVIGGRSDRTERIVGAGIGAVAGGAIGNYMDRQEAEIRRQTAGTGVSVIRQGDELLLRMPAAITFDFDSATVKTPFRATLDEVARTLNAYPATMIDVLGHTDSVGTVEYNQRLSEQRAQSVARYLQGQGVSGVRIATRGYGEMQPIASNDTEEGRAANRRVEIKVVPVEQQP